MSAFAGSQLSSEDVIALHTHSHDAMRGTFAADKHHNLPRPLRSYLSSKGDNISVLSSAMVPPPATSSSSSIFRTPQWNEFSDCVRELSPLAGERAGAGDDEDGYSEASDATHGGEVDGTRGSKILSSSRDRSVVDRLAELSQSPDVDPSAVAAALRDAENMLQHPLGNASVSTPAPRKHPQVSRGRSNLRTYGLAGVLDVEEQRRGQSTDGVERSSESHQADRRDHYHYQNGYLDQVRQQRSSRDGLEEFRSPAEGAHQPWTFRPNAPCSVGAAVPNPYFSRSHGWVPPNCQASVSLNAAPPAMGNASSEDVTVPWYEAYYAWMLYYQQLYAAQILKYEHRQRRMQRREARREKSRRRANRTAQESSLWAEQDDASNAYMDYYHKVMEGHAAQDARTKPAAEGGTVHQQPHRHEGEQCSLPRRHHQSRPSKLHMKSSTAANETYTERQDVRGRDVDASRTEVQQLRAQLQQLEEQLAALSARVAEEDGRNRGHREAGDTTGRNRGRSSARLPASGGRRDPEDAQLGSTAARLTRTKPPAAATWQALTERQRSRSGVSRDRGRHASPQQLQWR
ncbi:hypothetical protein ABL78_3838 [Leptomonas seymouri]|uniref:Uncharacterized protein n=1 Tax=Leptomonas seymouri TaxID=5684 RepID=A0A0N0P607_LEPSE|nr:hypothetical protein ABL78_3838 [Leptomonas seymouri]|eukprot:KPI87076.1 hypothetical protein ABL78_3838 [Leptomonas seymouri]